MKLEPYDLKCSTEYITHDGKRWYSGFHYHLTPYEAQQLTEHSGVVSLIKRQPL